MARRNEQTPPSYSDRWLSTSGWHSSAGPRCCSLRYAGHYRQRWRRLSAPRLDKIQKMRPPYTRLPGCVYAYGLYLFGKNSRVNHSLRPTEVLQCQTGVPYFGHVRDLVSLELHHVDVIRGDSPAGRRNRSALAGMGPIKYAICGNVVSVDIGRE